jgi:2,3-bisphosphoglycerate-independent phosphoglycerate mutase
MNKISKDEDNKRRPVMLCILDGWGERDGGEDNAIYNADTPVWDRMIAEYPTARLEASALDVGLPEGQMGNSEVGHMNLGAGRVVMQDLPLIDQAIAEDTFKDIPTLVDFVSKLKKSGGACHLLGLVSPGGVHSHQDHLIALAEIFAGAGTATTIGTGWFWLTMSLSTATAQLQRMPLLPCKRVMTTARRMNLCCRMSSEIMTVLKMVMRY